MMDGQSVFVLGGRNTVMFHFEVGKNNDSNISGDYKAGTVTAG